MEEIRFKTGYECIFMLCTFIVRMHCRVSVYIVIAVGLLIMLSLSIMLNILRSLYYHPSVHRRDIKERRRFEDNKRQSNILIHDSCCDTDLTSRSQRPRNGETEERTKHPQKPINIGQPLPD